MTDIKLILHQLLFLAPAHHRRRRTPEMNRHKYVNVYPIESDTGIQTQEQIVHSIYMRSRTIFLFPF